MNKEFNQTLFNFREHLKVLNRAYGTRKNYVYAIKRFISFLESAGINEIREVTRRIVEDYVLRITTKDRLAPSTLSNHIHGIKRFFEYLETNNLILINPAEYIQEPKRGIRLPRVVLTEDEVEKILNQPDLCIRQGIRDRTVLEVFYSTGIRLHELCGLSIYDADLQENLLRVKGKGSKERVVPLGKYAVRFLKEYLYKVRPHYTRPRKHKRQQGKERTNKLFVSSMGLPLGKETVEKMVKRHRESAGINKRVTPHAFRHTFATQLVRNGADIRAVQEMLGHTDLAATQIYTRVTAQEVKESHMKHHPGERE